MENTFDLTDQQKNVWNTEMFYSNTNVNNIGGYILIDEKVNFDLLENAANIYIKNTTVSRSHFVLNDGVVKQYIAEYIPFRIDLVNVNDINDVNALTTQMVHEPFNIVDSALFKFKMFRLPDGKGGIVPVFHHLINDAWGMGLFISEFMNIYSSLVHKTEYEFNFPPYSDYIVSSNEYRSSDKFNKDKEYWDSVFDCEPELTYISSIHNTADSSGNRKVCNIDKDVYSQIQDFCKLNRSSVYSFFMAIFSLYLSKINSTSSALIGTPVLNRSNFKEKQTSGMFVSTVPFKVDINLNSKFDTFLQKVGLNQTSIFRHQKYPYLELLHDVKEKYDINENLYDFVLSYQNIRDNKKNCDVSYVSTWFPTSNVAESLEAHFYDMDDTGNPSIYYNYQTAKFSEDDIVSLHERIINMAIQALNNPLLKDISVITDNDKVIIDKFNDTDYKYNKNESIIDIFEKVVSKNKEKTAAIFNDQSISYDSLDKESNRLANFLISKNVCKNDVVGIMLNRSCNLLVAIWGILKSGASYMLIDPALPEDRIDYMLSNAKSPFVISDLYLNYEKYSLDMVCDFSDELPKIDSDNNDRFCVIYTSGSTGTPKGVELRRLSVINMVNSYKKILNTDECNVFLSTSTVAFDMFIVENFVSILSGKTVVLANEDEQKVPVFTSKLILKHNIDFILSTPSKIGLLLTESDCLKNVKVIQLGGEVFKNSLYRSLRKSTSARIYNGYGPSECTACSSNKEIVDENSITIGTPFLNVKLHIMNKYNDILPIGVPGELVVSGDNVGLGYINKFSFDGIYRTGDIAILSKDGELIYCGRKDNQIKFHGLRIELSEITSKLMNIAGVRNAITVIKKVNNIDSICSYIIINSAIELNSELTEKSVKNILSKDLPVYMVPSHIMFLNDFPITLNGKIDTKNLPDFEFQDTDFVKPSNETEEQLLKIWTNVLNLNSISCNSNFFDLGGDSLCAIRLVSEVYSLFNVKIDIKDVFEYSTVISLSKHISELLSSKDSHCNVNISKHVKSDYYPVSSAQRRIFYTVNMDENKLAYNTPFGILFDTVPDVSKVESILNTLIHYHDAFRTYFELQDNDVVQKVVDNIDFKLKIVNYKNTDFIQPFDLSKAPLIHAELDEYDNKALLQLDFHHIICDGSSISIFAKEFCDLYNDKNITPAKFDYIDYSISEKIMESDKDYWIEKFNDGVPLLNMPTEFERGSLKSQDGNSIYDKLDNFSQINDFCKKFGITPYMFLLSVYYISLYKYTMQNDIVVGTPVSGRNSVEFSNVIGMFVNTLALKQNIQSSLKYSEFIKLVKSNCINAFDHQAYPFDDLVKNLNIPRDNSRNPLFDVMFIYESGGVPQIDLNDVKVSYIVPSNKTSKFDFSLELTPSSSSYNLRLEYCTKLFGEEFMNTFIHGYKNIINTILACPDIQISKIKMIDITEIYPRLEYPKNSKILDLFEAQVKKTPNSIALVYENTSYTYKELEIKVNQLANHLCNLNIHTGSDVNVIGIMLDRSAELIISMLAILKSGAGYLPIDPTYPEDRIKYIIEDSSIQVVVTQKKYENRFNLKTVLVDDASSYDEYKYFATIHSQNDIAYMIYTSGSTGRPKGVMLKQSSVVNFIHGICNRIPLEGKTIVSITTMCFDIFVLESLLPVCSGMKVVMASNDEQNNPILLNNLCVKNKVKIIQTTPSKFRFLISNDSSLDYIKNMDAILLGGEPFPIDLLKTLQGMTSAKIYNMYGPTETTVWSTVKDLTNSSVVTIGTPICNTHVLVLDNDMNEVPYNVPGMLYIGGDGVSLGYLNRPEVTAEKYIAFDGDTIYNSGDLVKLLPNGELECLGRADFQVKVRGLRIELGEIEQLMCSYKGVSSSVVTVKNINGRDLLCGYFVGDGRISISNLKHFLSKELPNYMVPVYLIQLDNFSYTPNGKIDRKLLPEPNFESKKILKPQTLLQKRISKIWTSILSIDEISIDDNFFDIGGDSLCALKMQLELMKLGININYGDIFRNNTIETLSFFIENDLKDTSLTIYKKKDFKRTSSLLKKNSTFRRLKLRQRQLKNVMLVGATGFLGIHVLAELLKIDDIKIYCLIRSDPSTSPENKLKNKFKYYFGSDLSNLFGTRLFVITGDITSQNFGMSNEQYDFLGNNVSFVVNCAALVKHYGDYKVFEKINYIGVKNLISFCEKFNKEFFHSSTISVSGNTMTALPSSYNPNRKVCFSENKLFINQSLDNVYVRSKFEAEKFMLEELANKKLRGIILRIGNITNRYVDGKFQENSEENAFLNRLKAFISLKMIPSSLLSNYVEFTPVDKLAESIVCCMKYYTYPMSVLHLYNSNHIYISNLISMLKELDININVVDDAQFNSTLQKWLYNNDKSDKVNVLLNDLDKNNKLLYRTNLIITNKFTLKFLNMTDFEWPKLDKEYIKKILKNL